MAAMDLFNLKSIHQRGFTDAVFELEMNDVKTPLRHKTPMAMAAMDL